MTEITRWRRLLSWLRPETVWQGSSAHNPRLEVVLDSGRLMLHAATVNYSYGGLHDAFRAAFRHLNVSSRAPRKALLLGFGAGCVGELLTRGGREVQLTGVEIDPAVIEAYRRFFPQHAKTELHQADAVEWVKDRDEAFDLIAVDLFIDSLTPDDALLEPFLHDLARLLSPKGLLVFNRIEEREAQDETDAFRQAFARVFPQFATFRTSINTFYSFAKE